MRKVYILIDANEGEVLQAPEEIEVVFIPWDKLANDPDSLAFPHHQDAIEDLEEALLKDDFERAEMIVRSLTEEPEDDYEDPAAYGSGRP